MPRLLHTLSQRPGRTGSGVTLEALVRHAAQTGWDQRVACGVPAADPAVGVGDLPPSSIAALAFDTPQLPFPVPGMSDVMPYRSTVFSQMTQAQLQAYRIAWREHLTREVESFQPEIIHTHHIWFMSAWLREVAADVPIVAHCHATGLRQLRRSPALAREVVSSCARIDAFCVLHDTDAETLRLALDVENDRIHVVGAGYNATVFHREGRTTSAAPCIVYAGKLSAAKGLPSLLDAFVSLRERRPNAELHIAGAGDGDEASALRERIESMQGVVAHGILDQQRLAKLFRSAQVCVLPSFFEGLPLVLVEAFACGCRIVATDLAGIREGLAAHLGDALRLVALPRLTAIDQPVSADLPRFALQLCEALDDTLALGEIHVGPRDDRLADLGWPAVCRRIETVWRALLRR